jgi:antitoxin component of MazEF toxin-antitoxin module
LSYDVELPTIVSKKVKRKQTKDKEEEMQAHTPKNGNYENRKKNSKDKEKEVGSQSCMG